MFEVQSASQNGELLTITPWSYTTTSASSIVRRLGSVLPVNQTGFAINYSIEVPVVYQLMDAAQHAETIIARSGQVSNTTLLPQGTISLRLGDRCPVNKSISDVIAVDRVICESLRYDWEFTQVLPTAGTAQVVEGGAYASAFFLSNIPGISAGKTYSVRVRPVHTSGTSGNWGAAHCMRIGSAGMILQSENQNESDAGMESRGSGISIYPNPTATGSFVLQYNGTRRDELIFAQEPTTSESNSDREPTTSESTFAQELVMMDISGKVVFQQQVVLKDNPVEIEFGGLASGVYVVMVGEERMRLIVE
jgi:hypothetical protein